MATKIFSKLKNSIWSVFKNKDPSELNTILLQKSDSIRPDLFRINVRNERSIVAAILNRIAVDCSLIDIHHVKKDDKGRFLQNADSSLERCLTVQANVDQTGREFVRDAVLSLLDEGCIAIVPTYADHNPETGGLDDVYTMRVGQITEWFPEYVRVKLYNDKNGEHEEVLLPKAYTAIIENPFYTIMNESSSTYQRLVSKLNALDRIDSRVSAGKLDLIVKVPYLARTDAKRAYTKKRMSDLEDQLANSEYGIGYIDGTEQIIQLNRAVENTFMNQIDYFTTMLYNQLGISESILNNTAGEQEMINYSNKTLEPILTALVEGMRCKFLSQTAITQGQDIMFFRNPFKLAPVEKIADIADKFTRNAILSSNEFRAIVGYEPVDDPRADELSNKNIASEKQQLPEAIPGEDMGVMEEGEYDLDKELTDLIKME